MGKERETLLPAGHRALTPAIALGAAGTVATIAQMTLLSDAVDRVLVSRPHLTSIGSLLLALLAVVVLRAVLAWGAEASAQQAALRLTTELRERLLAHLQRLGPAFVQRERSGELATTATEGMDRVEPYYRRYLPLQALSLIVPAIIILYLSRIDLPGALLLLVTAPIIPLLMVLVGSSAQSQVDRHWLALSRLGAQFLDTLQGLPTLLLFGRGDAAGEQVRAASVAFQVRTLQVLRAAFLSGMVLDIMTGMAIGLVAVVVAVQLLGGGLAFSSALLVLLLAPECYRPLQMLGAQRHTAMEGKAAGQRIAEILRTPAPVQPALPPTEGWPCPSTVAGGAGVAGGARAVGAASHPGTTGGLGRSRPPAITFSGVTYGYPIARGSSVATGPEHERPRSPEGYGAGETTAPRPLFAGNGSPLIERSAANDDRPVAQRPAVAGLTLTLPAGQRTALVGRSGAGKSTLVNLLMRFIDPDEGTISVDGLALNQWAPADWRARVALVPQQPHLFAGTIADNLRLARPDATASDLAWATKQAGATEFIARLPLGDATPVGEQGALLSAGQVQRLAIARAFLKDAPLLILDEPTSALDPASEVTVRQSLEALMAGRTVLVVAHRLNTIISADQIAVLEGGRVVETGSHRELLARTGAYAHLMGARSESPIQPPSRSSEETAGGYEECRAAPPYRPGAPSTTDDGFETGRRGEGVSPIAGRQGDRPIGRLLVSLCSHRGPIAASLLLAVLTAAAAVGLLATGAYLIGAAAIGTPILALGVPIALVRLFGIGRGITRYAERLASHRVTFSVLTDLRVWCYRKLLPLAPARILAYHSGDLLTRLIKDVEELQTVYLRVGAPLVVVLALSTLVVLLFAHFSLLLAAVLLGFLALAGGGIPWLMSALARAPQEQLVAGRAALQAHMIDMLQGLADLLALAGTPTRHDSAGRLSAAALQASSVGAAPRGCPPRLNLHQAIRNGLLGQPRGAAPTTPQAPLLTAAAGADLSRCDARVNRQRQRLARLAGLQELLSTLLAGLAMWTVLALAIRLSDLGALKPLYLALLVLVAMATVTAVQPLGEAFTAYRGATAAAERVYAVIDAAPAVVGPPHPQPAPATHAMTFDRVTFAYQAGAPAALRDVRFHLREGSRVAVVGPSGSGKTTLVNLLVRFWDPDSGTIRLGGQDLRDFALDDLRRRIGVVGQRTTIFNDTLRRNLLLARPEATDAELYRVLEQVRLIDLVAHSPQGLDRWVGEQGGQLSGGERQRLAIARTLLRDAPVLVLDEPTANLDPSTEHELLTELGMVMAGRTTLAITHRLIGLEQMDEILVLDEGRLVERGTHDHLVAQSGLYRRLLAVQEQVVVMV